jgi:predicted transcriptional regulator
MDEDINDAVGDILDQLKSTPKIVKQLEHMELSKENIEEFILKYTSELVRTSSEAVNNVSDYVASAPNADDVSALAELIKSSATAIDTLNKILINDKRHKTMIHIKQMDVESRKKEIDTVVGAKLLMSREELMKQFLLELKPVEGEIIEEEPKMLEQ